MNNSDRSMINLDMTSIRESGIKKFIDNYFWPVSDDEFHNFIEYINDEYTNLALKIKDEIMFDVAIIELSFFSQLENIFHYNYV